MSDTRRRRLVLILKLLLAGALGAWLFGSGRFDWTPLAALQGPHTWGLLGGAAGLVVASQVFTALRWRRIAMGAGLDIPFALAFRLNYIGILFNNFVLGGQGGDLVRLGLITRAYPERKADAAATLLVDRVLGSVGLCGATVLLTAVCWPALTYSARWGGIAASAVGVLALLGLALALAVPMTRLPLARSLARRFSALGEAYERVRGLRHRPLLLAEALGLALCTHATCLVAVGMCATALRLDSAAGLLGILWGIALTMLLNMVPVTPGNLGVAETVSGEVLRLLGASGGAPLFALYRAVSCVASLPALGLLFLERRGRGESSRPLAACEADGKTSSLEEAAAVVE